MLEETLARVGDSESATWQSVQVGPQWILEKVKDSGMNIDCAMGAEVNPDFLWKIKVRSVIFLAQEVLHMFFLVCRCNLMLTLPGI
jgi:hypothetical protein